MVQKQFQGLSVALHNLELRIYNIYRPQRYSAKLNLDHIFADLESAPSILLGDFNARHPIWNEPNSSFSNNICRSGQYLARLLHNFLSASLLNAGTPTHTGGGVLDLPFLSDNLLPSATWTIHPYLSSDHFATAIMLDTPRLRLPPPIHIWSIKRAD